MGRADQDAFALRSQQRWAAAQAGGFYRGEIVPVSVPAKKGAATLVDRDEHPRPDTTIESLAKLKGVVKPDGTVTAGNACPLNDGAADRVAAAVHDPDAEAVVLELQVLQHRIRSARQAHGGVRAHDAERTQSDGIDAVDLDAVGAGRRLALHHRRVRRIRGFDRQPVARAGDAHALHVDARRHAHDVAGRRRVDGELNGGLILGYGDHGRGGHRRCTEHENEREPSSHTRGASHDTSCVGASVRRPPPPPPSICERARLSASQFRPSRRGAAFPPSPAA